MCMEIELVGGACDDRHVTICDDPTTSTPSVAKCAANTGEYRGPSGYAGPMNDRSEAPSSDPGGDWAPPSRQPDPSRPYSRDPHAGGRDGFKGGGWASGILGALIGSGAVLAAAVKYGFDVAKTVLTERGKTRREQLRHDGQTERADRSGKHLARTRGA